MGAEYERWLIARGNVFAPSADAIVKLVAKLREEKWIIAPDSPELARFEFKGPRERLGQKTGAYAIRKVEQKFGEGRDALLAKIAASTESVPAVLDADWLADPSREDVALVWWVSAEKTSLHYPLTRRPDGPAYYRFEIHRAHDFVYPSSDSIDPIDTECRCGNDLSFDWDPSEVVNPFGAASGIHTECDDCSRTFDPAKVNATITNPFDESEAEVRGGAAYRFAIKIDCRDKFVEDASVAFAPELVTLVEKEFNRNFYEVGSVY